MAAGLYDPALYEAVHAKYSEAQCKAGGRARASTAKRHAAYKLFIPNTGTLALPSGYKHGQAGGIASGIARRKKARAKKQAQAKQVQEVKEQWK